MRRSINLNKNINMENEILDLIDRYWKFDNDQTPVSNWHDKQDLLEAVRKALRIHDVSDMLPNQTKRHIDLAYITGVFNVSGIDGLQKELTRLKEIGKNPH